MLLGVVAYRFTSTTNCSSFLRASSGVNEFTALKGIASALLV